MPTVVHDNQVTVTVSSEAVNLTVSPSASVTRVIGVQGPSGAASNTISATAGTNLSGHRVVALYADKAYYATSVNTVYAHSVAGVTTGAAEEGETATIRIQGEMTESSWSWTPGAPLFLGIDGAISESSTTGIYTLRVGHAVTATKVFIHIHQPIIHA